jgi:hypothetical protein
MTDLLRPKRSSHSNFCLPTRTTTSISHRPSITIRSSSEDTDQQDNAIHYFGAISGDDFSHPSSILFDVFIDPATFRELANAVRSGQEVFETYRCKPFGLAEPKRWIPREKGCDVSVVVLGSTRLTTCGDDSDPNCAVYDCRISVGPLGLHQPL